jgi:hypothetical protein
MMKSLYTLFAITLVLYSTKQLDAQPPDVDALEDVIVETYYISGPDDVQDGALPLGSVTYRVYADLKPGYEIQQIIAESIHPINISTDGQFYNNGFGTSIGSEFIPALLSFNTAALDSYVTIGASTSGHFGIPKEDDEDATSLLGATESFLQNSDPLAGIPLTEADGLLAGDVDAISTFDSNGEISASFGLTTSDVSLESTSVVWFNLFGISAPTEENKVLLGQFTVIGGDLNFCLNIQVIIPEELQTDTRTSIQFVAVSHPSDEEFNNTEDAVIRYQKDALCFDSGAVSTSDLEKAGIAIEIYPNPGHEEIMLQLNEEMRNARVEIFDMTGKLISSEILGFSGANQSFPINISNLDAGVYLLNVISDGKLGSKKFIKVD